MNYVTAKTAEETGIEGAVFETVNGSITAVRFGSVRIEVRNYVLAVLVPAPPKMVTRYRLTGSILDVPVDELFEYEYEAKARHATLCELASPEDFTIEKVEVAA